MAPSLRRILVGHEQTGYRKVLWPVVAVFVFLVTFTAYALNIFTISGGIVWIPGDAAVVGFIAATLVGYRNGGLIAAWLITFASLLGYKADHAFFGLSSQTFPEQFAYFLEPEGLLVLALEALVIGIIAFSLGMLSHWGINRLQNRTIPDV